MNFYNKNRAIQPSIIFSTSLKFQIHKKVQSYTFFCNIEVLEKKFHKVVETTYFYLLLFFY